MEKGNNQVSCCPSDLATGGWSQAPLTRLSLQALRLQLQQQRNGRRSGAIHSGASATRVNRHTSQSINRCTQSDMPALCATGQPTFVEAASEKQRQQAWKAAETDSPNSTCGCHRCRDTVVSRPCAVFVPSLSRLWQRTTAAAEQRRAAAERLTARRGEQGRAWTIQTWRTCTRRSRQMRPSTCPHRLPAVRRVIHASAAPTAAAAAWLAAAALPQTNRPPHRRWATSMPWRSEETTTRRLTTMMQARL